MEASANTPTTAAAPIQQRRSLGHPADVSRSTAIATPHIHGCAPTSDSTEKAAIPATLPRMSIRYA